MSNDEAQIAQQVRQTISLWGRLLFQHASNQILIQVDRPDHLKALAAYLKTEHYYLVTVAANDEQRLEDGCFKIYYVFSHPSSNLFLIIEYLLAGETYPSLYDYFPAVDPFEREMRDLFGLVPQGSRAAEVPAGRWLCAGYPPELYPMRAGMTLEAIQARVRAYVATHPEPTAPPMSLPDSSVTISVGPVHAGLIEPGRFEFTVAGEVIDDLQIHLGYVHRGIERLFQSRMSLEDGWQLAEHVSGDSSFAHTLAYCHAVEALADTSLPRAADILRGVFLELERIVNHIGDLSVLAHDVALELLAMELATIREEFLRLNDTLTGHRYLRGLNRPGGIVVGRPLDALLLRRQLDANLTRFRGVMRSMTSAVGFRERTRRVGTLSRTDAIRCGATGLVARASNVHRDYRYYHQFGIYADERIRAVLEAMLPQQTQLPAEEQQGDVYARVRTRAIEVDLSALLISEMLDLWCELSPAEQSTLRTQIRLSRERNYAFVLGYAEGWRGDIVYWLMQHKLGYIYRCKVRDPSMLNWPAERHAIISHRTDAGHQQTLLADFPLINRSFNLSYAGNDL